MLSNSIDGDCWTTAYQTKFILRFSSSVGMMISFGMMIWQIAYETILRGMYVLHMYKHTGGMIRVLTACQTLYVFMFNKCAQTLMGWWLNWQFTGQNCSLCMFYYSLVLCDGWTDRLQDKTVLSVCFTTLQLFCVCVLQLCSFVSVLELKQIF